LLLADDDKKIIVPPGVWAAAITRLAGAMAFASDEDLHNGKTGQKVFGRVVAKIFNEVRGELEEYLSLNEDDDEAMEGFIPELMEGMGLTFVRGPGAASAESSESEETLAAPSHLVFGDFDTLTDRLENEVIGQPGAVEAVVEGLLVPAAGLNDSTKPVRSMMFLGPTGVGKTKLALTLAAELMIDPLNVVRLDMSEYSQQNEAVKLFGAPPGYVGHGQGGALTTPVEKNPRSLILLDEVEKAHPMIWDSFLQVFDSGRMTTGAGKVIDFSQTVIVMTSNLGSRELARKSAGFLIGNNSVTAKSDAEIQSTIFKEVEQFFKPEMINRIDDLIIFKDLSLETTRKIVSKEIDLVRHRANLAGYSLEEPNDDIIEAILQKTDVSKYGARQIQRTVLKYISNPIARSMLKKTDSSMELSLVINDNQEISVLEK
jgi:ATP-dependent Clp protease ATP-binding subunit ClpA